MKQVYYRNGDELNYQNVPNDYSVNEGEVLYDPNPTTEQLVQDFPFYGNKLLNIDAKNALTETDMVALRCWKAGVEFPSDWKTYTEALRDIIRTGEGSLPTKPTYPQNT